MVQLNPEDAKLLKQLQDTLEDDKLYTHVFSSMCTPPIDISRMIASEFAEINLGDPGLFPNTVKMEKEVLAELANILNAPESWTGTISSGGSESNLIGCWTARNWCRKVKKITNGKILFPQSAHVSFEKAADILNLKSEWIELDNSNKIDIEKLKEKIDANTVGVIGIAGTTGTGVCDDIKALSEIALDNNIYLHVDAAHGGMILPFLKELGYNQPDFDFKIEGVKSITIDTHKILGSLIPGGCTIFRSAEYSDTIAKGISYLSDPTTKQLTVTGTRPGNSVISSWLLLKKKGREFILNRVKTSLETTDYFVSKLKEIEEIKLTFDPTINIIGFTNTVLSTKELVKKMYEKGWHLSIYSNWARIVVMPHVKKKMIDKFIIDLKNILKKDEE